MDKQKVSISSAADSTTNYFTPLIESSCSDSESDNNVANKQPVVNRSRHRNNIIQQHHHHQQITKLSSKQANKAVKQYSSVKERVNSTSSVIPDDIDTSDCNTFKIRHLSEEDWLENMDSASPKCTNGPQSPDSEGEKRRGRPRSDVVLSLIMQGTSSPSSIKCNYCGRVFPREKSLQAHLRTHTGEKPYVCDFPECGRAFTQSGQLKTHQRLHAGEKPFVCSHDGCTVRFTHANRHCPHHPDAILKRSNDCVLRPVITNDSAQGEQIKQWLERYRKDRELAAKALLSPPAAASPKPREVKKRTAVKLEKPSDPIVDDLLDGYTIKRRKDALALSSKNGERHLKRPSTIINSLTSSSSTPTRGEGEQHSHSEGITTTVSTSSTSATPQQSHLIMAMTPTSSQLSPGATDENLYVDPNTNHRFYANFLNGLSITHAANQINNNNHNSNHVNNMNSINSMTITSNDQGGSQITPMGISFQSNCIRGHMTTPKSSQTHRSMSMGENEDHYQYHHRPGKLKRRWLESALEQSFIDEGRFNTRSENSSRHTSSDAHSEDQISSTSAVRQDTNTNNFDIYTGNTKKDKHADYSRTANGDFYLRKYPNQNMSINVTSNCDTPPLPPPPSSSTTTTTSRPSVLVMARSASNSPTPEINDETAAAAKTLINLRNITTVTNNNDPSTPKRETHHQYATFHGSNGMFKKFHADETGQLVAEDPTGSKRNRNNFHNHDNHHVEQYHVVQTIVVTENNSNNNYNHFYYNSSGNNNNKEITSEP